MELEDQRATPSSALVVISSHEGAAHNHRKIKDFFWGVGVPAENVHVKHGCVLEEAYHGDCKVQHNQMCFFNWKFRWTNDIHHLLLHSDRAISHVVTAENNAFAGFDGKQTAKHIFFTFLDSCPDRADVLWAGFRYVHEPGTMRYYKEHTVI